MTVTLSLLALLFLVGALIYIKRGSGGGVHRSTAARPASSSANTTFHAVSIKFGPRVCEAAQEMAGKRFLSGAAPRIPLPNCDVLECKCRFVHHKDRRASEDRRSPFGQSIASPTGTHPKEQRQGQDRRHDDSDDIF